MDSSALPLGLGDDARAQRVRQGGCQAVTNGYISTGGMCGWMRSREELSSAAAGQRRAALLLSDLHMSTTSQGTRQPMAATAVHACRELLTARLLSQLVGTRQHAHLGTVPPLKFKCDWVRDNVNHAAHLETASNKTVLQLWLCLVWGRLASRAGRQCRSRRTMAQYSIYTRQNFRPTQPPTDTTTRPTEQPTSQPTQRSAAGHIHTPVASNHHDGTSATKFKLKPGLAGGLAFSLPCCSTNFVLHSAVVAHEVRVAGPWSNCWNATAGKVQLVVASVL